MSDEKLPADVGQRTRGPAAFWSIVVGLPAAALPFLMFGATRWPAVAVLLLAVPVALAGLVQNARHSSAARVAAFYLWLAGAVAAVGVTGLMVLGSFLTDGQLPPGFLRPTLAATFVAAASALAGLACFSPGVRRWAAVRLPFEPKSFPQTLGLATSVVAIGCSLTPLLILGRPVALVAEEATGVEDLPAWVPLVALLGQFAWMMLVTWVAAGWPTVRSAGETLRRLGVGPVGGSALAASVVITLALVVGVQVFERIQTQVWNFFGWPTTDSAALERTLGFIRNPSAPLLLGTAAGLAEELFVRGLLQPRLGLLLPNVLFAALHSLQYQWDGVLGVFLIGSVCGLVRNRWNTTASMIVHGLYDVIVMYQFALTRPTPG
jgi:membrane protease YdiL (CAAX protease family)